ncbi:MAG TPA: peptidoglycan DD-metalloendopeptidase family protein [Anaerolineales bacterium]|nr:peptidoglycan DD-metalloendopeptidase family protein [Anaerolineales bacterium]HMR98420.1 peptidoglycan DD-metalloendopeptidase family protein [Anaerolineales bacterium]HNQ93899.1 peptidoglycan DD-metalloendopeptidase family protein [Anaerolineales bacterium]HNS60132.1 peptidoglycan DD-metalloendopeptidase family protein [Anaerolineales bacterium]
MPKRLIRFCLAALFVFIAAARPVFAQTDGPVYIVQPGDTLFAIAGRFNLSVNDLIEANPSIDPGSLAVGQELVIPGLEGLTGKLETEVVTFGDSLRSLLRRTQVSSDNLRRLNRLISPSELYVGINLILPVQDGQTSFSARLSPAPSESLFEMAIKQGSDSWTLSSINKLDGTWAALPGDVLYSPTIDGQLSSNASGLPSGFLSASISPLPIQQGSTEVIRVRTAGDTPVFAILVDKPLQFFGENGDQIALQGIHALLEPGLYPLKIQTILPDGSAQSFEQMVVITSGNYFEEELIVDPATIDPLVTEPESNTILSVVAPSTPVRNWNGQFTAPAVYADQFTSYFGTRRIYHGSGTDQTIQGFHSGLDFSGGEGLQIFAPAPGRVVFAAPLTVRGNATIIDHGWGVYSGFWHQSEILVHVGDFVEQGQVIGLVGETGRVTGAHLHWEVWVNGVQVNPLEWLNQTYP